MKIDQEKLKKLIEEELAEMRTIGYERSEMVIGLADGVHITLTFYSEEEAEDAEIFIDPEYNYTCIDFE
jgi:hypothetical protein